MNCSHSSLPVSHIVFSALPAGRRDYLRELTGLRVQSGTNARPFANSIRFWGSVKCEIVATANHAIDSAGTLQKWAGSSTSQLHSSRDKSLDQLMLVFKLYGGPTSGL